MPALYRAVIGDVQPAQGPQGSRKELLLTIVNNSHNIYTISGVRLCQHSNIFCSGVVHAVENRKRRFQYHALFYHMYDAVRNSWVHFDTLDPVTLRTNKERYRNQFKFCTMIDFAEPFVQHPLYRVVRFQPSNSKTHEKYVDLEGLILKKNSVAVLLIHYNFIKKL